MPLDLIFNTPDNYTINDDGIPGNNTSVIRNGTGTVIFTFVHPVDSLGFTVSSPGVNLTVNLTDSLGAANFTIGNLTDPTVTPDSITIGNVRTTGNVTLVSNGAITELNSDAGADIVAGQLILSANTGVGTAGNAIETQTGLLEAEATTGGINLSNFGSVQIGGISADVDGLDVATSGNINFSSIGTILLGDETGPETVHGGTTSGDVTLTASGFDADVIATTDQDAINAPGGNIVVNAGRDIAFGIIGADFDNDVRARGSVTFNAGRDVLVDGFSDLASDDFGGSTSGNLVVNAGRNIHVRNVAGTDGSMTASGSAGADVILTTGAGGAVVLDAPSSGAVTSFDGDVIVNADRILIAAASGITASSGEVFLRPATAGREIILGSAGDAAFAVELSDAELDRIFTATLTIGSLNPSGTLSVISAISPANAPNLVLQSGEDVAVQANITATTSLLLRAGDNLYHTGGTINTVTLNAFVDDLGGDGGAGGFGQFGTIVGTTVTLDGLGDNDTLHGAEGIDQIVHGNGGNDTITSSGEGHYFGDAGNDLILAGLSSGAVPEVLDGGADIDTLDTRSYTGDYVINLATGVTNFGYESFINFENIITGEGADQITGTSGDNVISTNEGTDTILAGGGNDTLDGGADNDVLNGGSGIDTMAGGIGSDAYFVDAAGDVVTENVGEGSDAVYASLSHALAANVEHLYLQGVGNFSATGNALPNFIQGNSGNNVLNGLGGADAMAGGAGGDAYFVDHAMDVVTENAGEGTDAVYVTVSHMLAVNVEHLYMQGAAPLHGAGNALSNFMQGNSGNNMLNGSFGADVLEGGAGNDTFVLNAGLANGDTMLDFNGNSAGVGDSIQFVGYGAGVSLINLNATQWQLTYNGGMSVDIITFANAAALHGSDFSFI
jgi:Ca2+-binding RTX toxin-like protein